MDDTKIGYFIPSSLQRRINRIIKIDDILSDGTASPEDVELDEIVC